MKKLIAALLFAANALFALPADATTYFVAGCGTGSVAACVAGSDANSTVQAQNPATPWASCSNLTATFIQGLAGGDIIKFVRGGSITNCALSGGAFYNANSTVNSPITMDSYTAAGFQNLTDSGTSSAIGTTTLTDGSKAWTVNQWTGYEATVVWLGKTQNLTIASNTATTLTLKRADGESNWYITPTPGTQAYTIQGARSIIGNGGNDVVVLAHNAASLATAGWTVKNLQFLNTIGTDATALGTLFEQANGLTDVIIDNTTFTGGSLGVYCESGTPSGGTAFSQRLIIRNNIIQRTKGAGILSACPSMLAENNIISRNGSGDIRDHSIYLDGPSGGTDFVVKNVTVRDNWILDAARSGTGACTSTSFVIHNQQQFHSVVNNLMSESVFSNSNQCLGISYSQGNSELEGFADIFIGGNTVVNYPGTMIGIEICNRCTITSNYLYSSQASTFADMGIIVPQKDSSTPCCGDVLGSKVTVTSNTIYMAAPNQYSRGIELSRDGTGHIVASNLIYMGSSAVATSSCFTTDGSGQGSEDANPLPAAAFTTFDYNLCYYAGSTQGSWNYFDGTGLPANSTLALQKSVRGHDTHSIQPTTGSLGAGALITVPTAPFYRLVIPTGSAAKNAGHPTLSGTLTPEGYVRASSGDAADIGAFEFGVSTAVVPAQPTRINVQ